MAQPAQKPLRVGVVGLVHTHVHGIFRKVYKEAGQKDIEIVGIAAPNRALAERYAKQYGFPTSLVYPTLAEMLDKAKPEAVTDFGCIADHLQTVKARVPRGIPVMVEKPLSVSFEQAKPTLRKPTPPPPTRLRTTPDCCVRKRNPTP